MKNENEYPDIEQAQHERLCAYVFGELAGAERAAFEAELLRSPELQRERERLTATIGLVKRAVPDEGLSTAVRRDILASARRSRFHFLSGRRLMLVAAAVVAVMGGVFAVRGFDRGGERGPFLYSTFGDEVETYDEVASAPEPIGAVERSKAAEMAPETLDRNSTPKLEGLRGLGYVGSDGPAVTSAPAAAAPVPTEEVREQLEALGDDGEGDAQALAWNPQSGSQEVPTDGFFLGAHAGKTPEKVNLTGGASIGVGSAKLTAMTEAEAAQVISLGALTQTETGQYGEGTPSAFAARRAAGGDPVTKRKGASAATKSAPARALAPPAAGGYLGQGDTKPARVALEDKVESELAFEEAGMEPAETARKKLEALGYGGGDDSDEARKSKDSFQSQRQPVRTREQVAAQVEELLGASRVAPGETPSAMFFRYFGDSPFLPAGEQTTSTFAVDVDTASYALARAYLNRGELPPREAVRTEEFVNYFKADQPAPTDGQPFAIGLELAPSLFAKDARTELLRISVRARDVADFERKPVALTFVIDNSGSMNEGGRLELVKRSLALLLRQLYASDSVAIVKFSNQAAVVTPMVPATRRGELEGLIQGLATEGGTNVEAGLRLGYEVALQSLARNTVNRVILCSDGVGNIGETSAKGLLALVQDARANGIYLNTVGVGMGNHNDAFLEELADKGDGSSNYVDSDAEAKRVFVDGLASALQPVARDVKIQVEFDPRQVESWRLLGYENRALREQDFRDDKIDAGEVNAGHQVTALYELVRQPSRSGPLATVRLRYKPPFAIDQGKEGERARAEGEQARELERTLEAASVLPGFAAGTGGYQRAVLVAQFAESLRQSAHARGDSFADLLREARRLEKTLGDPDFTEFVTLLEKANPLLDARAKQETPHVQQLLDELGGLHYEQALRERKHELSLQAGEPTGSAEEQREAEKAAKEIKERIQRLEAEVRTELFRASGVEQPSQQELDQLRDIGYAEDK